MFGLLKLVKARFCRTPRGDYLSKMFLGRPSSQKFAARLKTISVRFFLAIAFLSVAFGATAQQCLDAKNIYTISVSLSNFFGKTLDEACGRARQGQLNPVAVGISISPVINTDGIQTGLNFTCHYTTLIFPGGLNLNGAVYCPQPGLGFGFCEIKDDCQSCKSVANPVSLADGSKIERSLDWVSPKEPRFNFERHYSSNGYTNLDRTAEGWGNAWSSVFMQRLEQRTTGTRLLYLRSGRRHHFVGTGATTPTNSDHNYGLTLNVAGEGGRHVVGDGTGKIELYVDVNPSLALLDEIRWPDGYQINLFRDASNRLTHIEDNRAQRVEFTWDESLNPNVIVPVVTGLEVDTNYDGSTFAADVRIDYTYEYRSFFRTDLLMTKS